MRDDENKMIYYKLYNFHFGEDLTIFDYVLNTDKLSLDSLIEISKLIVRRHTGVQPLRILPQLENLIKIDDDVTNDNYGHYPDKRSIESLLVYGLVLVDKPAGPTSHEVVAWIKRILEIEKAGHSGTLDPGATGLLPVGLGEGTKALSVLLLGPKEYYALGRFHSHISPDRLEKIIQEFTDEIYQRPAPALVCPTRDSGQNCLRIRLP